MAEFAGTFDATTIEPNKPLDVLPNGDYVVVIADSKWVATKKGDGQFLELTLDIVQDGPVKGRKLWDRLNLSNPNPQAVEIAQKTLSAICHATDVLQVKDSAQLHGRPLLAKVTVSQGPNGPTNEVKGYKRIDTGGSIGAIVPTPAPTAAAGPAVAPWLAKKAG